MQRHRLVPDPPSKGVRDWECVVRDKTIERQRTWVCDIAANRFVDLKPRRIEQRRCRTSCFCQLPRLIGRGAA